MGYSIPPIQGIDLARIDQARSQNALLKYQMDAAKRSEALAQGQTNALAKLADYYETAGAPEKAHILRAGGKEAFGEMVKVALDPKAGFLSAGDTIYDVRSGKPSPVAGGLTLGPGGPMLGASAPSIPAAPTAGSPVSLRPPPAPSAAPAAGSAMPPQAAAPGGYATRVAMAESGGNPNARNPNSSATGAGQFIDSTWLDVMQRHAPDLAAGKTEEQILAMRSDPELSRRMIDAYAADNKPVLSQALGRDPTDQELYLGHFLGGQGAAKFLSAPPTDPATRHATPAAVMANRNVFFDGGRPRTVGEVTQLIGGKVGGGQGGGDVTGGGAPGQQAPQPVYRNGKPFTDGAPQGMQWGWDGRRMVAMPVEGASSSTLSPQEVTALGLPAGTVVQRKPSGDLSILSKPETLTPEQEAQKIRLAQAGRPSVNVQVSGDKKGAEKLYTDAAEAFTTAQNAGRQASRNALLYDQFEQALEGFRPGAGAETRLKATQLLRDAGIPVQGVPDGELAKVIGAQLELAAAQSMKGQGQITENERAILKSSIPALTTTMEGNKRIIELMRRLDAYDLQVAQVYRENAKKNGGIVDPVSVAEDVAKLGAPLSNADLAWLQKGGRKAPQGLPPVDQRVIGSVYDTPRGPAKWMGNGWELQGQGN